MLTKDLLCIMYTILYSKGLCKVCSQVPEIPIVTKIGRLYFEELQMLYISGEILYNGELLAVQPHLNIVKI